MELGREEEEVQDRNRNWSLVGDVVCDVPLVEPLGEERHASGAPWAQGEIHNVVTQDNIEPWDMMAKEVPVDDQLAARRAGVDTDCGALEEAAHREWLGHDT